MEQRYHAVMEVVSGAPVAEVARAHLVSRLECGCAPGERLRESEVPRTCVSPCTSSSSDSHSSVGDASDTPRDREGPDVRSTRQVRCQTRDEI
jgi:hypothetical protein